MMQTQVMAGFLQRVRVGDPQVYANLEMVPLIGEDGGLHPFALLSQALLSGSVEVQEVEDGVVSELLVMNWGDRDILLIMGEEMVGAMQNRTVNLSIIVPAHESLRVPVSCTEKGRWQAGRWGKKMAATSGHCSSVGIREALADSVSQSLKSRRRLHSDQRGIWESVEASLRRAKVASSTFAQDDLFTTSAKSLYKYLEHF